jgi:hypothetical protein
LAPARNSRRRERGRVQGGHGYGRRQARRLRAPEMDDGEPAAPAAAAHISDDEDSDANTEGDALAAAAAATSVPDDGSDDDGDGDDPDGYAWLVRRGTPAAARSAARAWLARVQVDGPGAVAAALSMVVDAARPGGAPREECVTPAMIVANESAEAVAKVCDAMVEDVVDRARFFAKRGRAVFVAFWKSLVEECEDAILYDTDCFDTLLSWLEVMSCAMSRPLRLTACVAAYAVVDGLISVGGRVRADLATAQRQLSTEERRKSGKHAALSVRGKDLQGKVDTLSANNTELTELTDKVFTATFVLKYRDVAAEVRVASVVALGSWTLRYPEHFLDDTHNKYVGWLLFDKAPTVRRAALEMLAGFFQEPKFAPSLDMFLRRFIKRIVEMSTDKDVEVCIAAVRLCTLLVPLEALGQDDSVDTISALASAEQPELRRAAGAFVAALVRLAADEGEEGRRASQAQVSAPTAGKRKGTVRRAATAGRGVGKKPSKAAELAATAADMDTEKAKEDLREVIFSALGDGAGDVAVPGLVLDAVWEHLPAVHCWPAYRELLLEYADVAPSERTSKKGGGRAGVDPDADRLGKDDMVSVAGLLLAAAHHVETVPARKGRGKAGAAAAASEERISLTACFLPVLPKLMTLFRTDSRVLAVLAELPRMFDASICGQSGSAGHFKVLLTKLGDVLARGAGSPTVLIAATQTLKHLASGGSPLANDAVVALTKEATGAARALHAAVRAGVNKASAETVAAAVARAAIVSELMELPESAVDDALVLMRARCDGIAPLCSSRGLGVDNCRLIANALMWSSARLVSSVLPGGGGGVDEDEAEEVVRAFAVRRDEVLELLARSIGRSGDDDERSVRVSAFKAACLIISLSVGVRNRLSLVAANGEEGNNVPVPSLSRQVTDLLRVDGDEGGLFDALTACFLDVIASRCGKCRNVLLRSGGFGGDPVPDMDREARDVLAAFSQVAIVGAMPADALHLPLLGLLLRRARGQAGEGDLVSGYDVAKLYYRRVKVTLSPARVTALEVLLLHDAAKVDRMSIGDEGDAPSVRALANAIARDYTLTPSQGGGCAKLLNKLVSSGLANKHESHVGVIDGDGDEDECWREELLRRRSVMCIAGSVLAARVSRSVAKSLLDKLESEFSCDAEDDNGEESERRGLAEFRQCVEAVANGARVPLHRRPATQGQGRGRPASTSMRRSRDATRSRRRKEPDDDGGGASKTGRNIDVDLANVRRSGRTQRKAYVEVESDHSDSESDRSEGGGAEESAEIASERSPGRSEPAGDRSRRPPEEVEGDGDTVMVEQYRVVSDARGDGSREQSGAEAGKMSTTAPRRSARKLSTDSRKSPSSHQVSSPSAGKRRNTGASPPARKSVRLTERGSVDDVPRPSAAPRVERSTRGRRW